MFDEHPKSRRRLTGAAINGPGFEQGFDEITTQVMRTIICVK
jgi:hypothetical protein